MNKQYKDDFLRAGQLAKEVRSYGLSLIRRGASYNDVIQKIYAKIKDLGAFPAFPPQIALNDIAAHFLPDPEQDILFTNQVIKLDIGVCYNGAIGDCAATVDLSGRYQKLIDAAEAALLAAEKKVQVGVPVREIGKVIESAIASYGFTSVKNLSGHGLGHYKVHMPPNIPNYYDRSQATIQPGMTFAIEPFATNGVGLIYEAQNPTIFSLIGNFLKNSRIPGSLVDQILSFRGLPFAVHDLIHLGLSLTEVRMYLSDLIQKRILAGYPPLVEEAQGMVAQAENSILVDDDGQVFISTR